MNKINSTEPMIISVAPLPIRSYTLPKSGVRNKVPNGNRLGIVPANSGSTLYFCTIRSVAYFKKGNTAE